MKNCPCAYCSLAYHTDKVDSWMVNETTSEKRDGMQSAESYLQNMPPVPAPFAHESNYAKTRATAERRGENIPNQLPEGRQGKTAGKKCRKLISKVTFFRNSCFVIAVIAFCQLTGLAQQTAEIQPVTDPAPTPGILAPEAAKAGGANHTLTLESKKTKPLAVLQLAKAPVIDGHISDGEWDSATFIKDFLQIKPGDNTQPSNQTEVSIGYDSKFLYIAFRAYDDASKVRATLPKRDSITKDDLVGLILDTFNDQRRAYILAFNPLGVQQDGIYTEDRGIDYSVDIVMQSNGKVTEKGYEVEIAIPFRSLRYEIGKGKMWRVHFFRETRRLNNEVDSWMPIIRGKSGVLNQAGLLTGFESISNERTLEIIPSLTLLEEGKRVRTVPASVVRNNPSLLDPGRLVNRPVTFDPGISIKLGLSSNVSFNVAINPDFAQVEADQPVITANQRFPIFFDERRPFFLEGIEIFKTALNVVHTRTIIDPDYAVKLTGKRGRNSFGVLFASDNAPGNYSIEERDDPEIRTRIQPFLDKNSYVGVLRLKRDIGRDSNIGLIATSYNFINKHNQVGGLDGRFRVNQNTMFEFQVLGTSSRATFFDPDLGRNLYRTGNGFGYNFSYEQSGRNWGYELSGQGRTRDYRTDVGFVKRTNTNSEKANIRYSSDPNPQSKLISWRLTNSLTPTFDWKGRLQNWDDSTKLALNFQKQTTVGLSFKGGYERIFEEEFGPKRTATRSGAFAGGDPERSSYQKAATVTSETTLNQRYSFAAAFNYSWGLLDYDFGAGRRFPRVSLAALANPSAPLDPGPGNGLQAQFVIIHQPTQSLRTSLSYIKSKLTRYDTNLVAYEDNIFTLRSTYQFTRFITARTRIDYSTLSARIRGQFLVGWAPSPGTAFFVGYNDDLNYSGFNPFTGQREPSFQRNGRSFFIKLSYLIQRGF